MNTWQLGSLTLQSRLIQGPLAGYSCAPMRVQTWKFSSPAFCSSEMISANTILRANIEPRFSHRDPLEQRLCVQLSGTEPDTLALAARQLAEQGVEIIELNCGCPVAKIRKKGAGSKLLSTPDQLFNIISAMRASTDAVISVKIRVQDMGLDGEIAALIEKAGADCIVVHGRQWSEKYDVATRYAQIALIKAAVSIPVIGNGDVSDLVSLKQMLATGVDAVMIARAGLGQPWLIAQLEAELNGHTFTPPALQDIGQSYLEHIHYLAQLDGETRALLQARKLAKYYGRARVADVEKLMQAVIECRELSELERVVAQHFNKREK